MSKAKAEMMKQLVDLAARELGELLSEVRTELTDAAEDILSGTSVKADLAARLRARADRMQSEIDRTHAEAPKALTEIAEVADAADKRIWREGFAASLRTFAHWHESVQQVGSTGTTLKKALQDLEAGKFDDEYAATLHKLIAEDSDNG